MVEVLKDENMISGVEVKQLKPIKDERGLVMEILRSDDKIFEKFGQVYISVCNPGYVKAWHYHKLQNDFFAVVKGNAKVVLYDNREDSSTKGEVQEFEMGEKNPILIKIPPLVIHGFTALGKEQCFLVNCSTEPYNHGKPDEYKMPFDSKEIPYDWGVEKGW
jgi:dTDP-4-dehydrorhamnose 3,5-epimerase